ncbi:hypothetical protein Bca4012_103514 [Brassica carinata]
MPERAARGNFWWRPAAILTQIARLTWVGRVAALLSHPTESSSKWAIFGKRNLAMRDEPKPGYGAQLRANLEPTKGVGRLRQQDGGHGSRTAKECVTTHLPNQLAPKWMALKRDLYPPPGKSQASMSRRARGRCKT